MDAEQIQSKIKELDAKIGWYQNIELGYGLHTKTRSLWGEDIDHPRQRWESVSPGFPKDFTGKTVLDVGCNAGFFSFKAAERGAKRIVAVDYSEKYIEQARFCNAARGANVDFRVANVHDITQLGTFDITLCIGLLYHVQDIAGAIRGISRVTKELAVVESAIHPGNNDLPLCLVASGTGRTPGYWHPNMTALKFMFQKAGFARCEDLFVRGGRGGILAYKS